MDHSTLCAAVYRDLACHVIRRPNMVDKQKSVLCGLFAGHTPDHAFRINTQVGETILTLRLKLTDSAKIVLLAWIPI